MYHAAHPVLRPLARARLWPNWHEEDVIALRLGAVARQPSSETSTLADPEAAYAILPPVPLGTDRLEQSLLCRGRQGERGGSRTSGAGEHERCLVRRVVLRHDVRRDHPG